MPTMTTWPAQAEDAHRAGFFAMTAGLALIAAGIIVALVTDVAATKYSAALITAAGVATSGYIAETFIRVREQSAHQMTYYFQQPLVQSYLLTAERLADRLPEERQVQQIEAILKTALGQTVGAGEDAPASEGPSKRQGGLPRSRNGREPESLTATS